MNLYVSLCLHMYLCMNISMCAVRHAGVYAYINACKYVSIYVEKHAVMSVL